MTENIPDEIRKKIPAGKRYALIIGVGANMNDKKGDLSLAYAAKDGLDFAYMLTDPEIGFTPKDNVLLLMNSDQDFSERCEGFCCEKATHKAIRKGFSWLAETVKPADTVFIYYSGHGAKEGSEGYWIAHDTDINDLLGTGFSNYDLKRYMSSIHAQRVFTFIDCCYAESMRLKGFTPKSIGKLTPGSLIKALKGTGTLTMYASGQDQPAGEHVDLQNSVFTHFLIRGMRGDADLDNSGVVEASELAFYMNTIKDKGDKYADFQDPHVELTGTPHFAVTLHKKRVLKLINEENKNKEEMQNRKKISKRLLHDLSETDTALETMTEIANIWVDHSDPTYMDLFTHIEEWAKGEANLDSIIRTHKNLKGKNKIDYALKIITDKFPTIPREPRPYRPLWLRIWSYIRENILKIIKLISIVLIFISLLALLYTYLMINFMHITPPPPVPAPPTKIFNVAAPDGWVNVARVVESAGPGSKVVFVGGTYLADRPIQIPSGVTVKGERGVKILLSNPQCIFLIEDKKNVVIQNLNLSLENTLPTAESFIHVRRSQNVKASGVWIDGERKVKTGFLFASSEGAISHSEAKNHVHHGITIQRDPESPSVPSDVAISKSKVHQNRYNGILFESSSGKVGDSEAWENGANGIAVKRDPQSPEEPSNVTLANNKIHANKESGILYNASKGAIVKNESRVNRTGITVHWNAGGNVFASFFSYPQYRSSVTIEGNTVRDNDEYGIVIYYSEVNLGEGNTFEGNKVGGFWADKSSTVTGWKP
ncbi:MAG: right-handed parallel beta-helix repeat-containing protein [Gammaproteobacteria bacterium]|nr:right-handed parallel beta-helix repeat-containing protein [Gammaproteobacteria bacterium]